MFSWGGNPGVGSLYRIRDAVDVNGVPLEMTFEEHSHAAMANAYEAGAAGLTCAVFKGYLGIESPEGQPADPHHQVPLHRRGADRDSGTASRCGHHPCPARGPARERAG